MFHVNDKASDLARLALVEKERVELRERLGMPAAPPVAPPRHSPPPPPFTSRPGNVSAAHPAQNPVLTARDPAAPTEEEIHVASQLGISINELIVGKLRREQDARANGGDGMSAEELRVARQLGLPLAQVRAFKQNAARTSTKP